MKKVLLITALIALAGCEQRYRYPCQDPSNWDKEECKKPICEINRDCPELILGQDNKKPTVPPPPPSARKDCCK